VTRSPDPHRQEQLRLLGLLGQRAETRQLVALNPHRSMADGLVLIERGQADQLRPSCRAGDLICPVSDCPSPALSTRGGKRRDHFFHLHRSATAHGPERLAHQHAKAVLAHWIQQRHRDLEVVLEAPVETGQRADVLVTSPQSGKRLAIEMQCSSLSAADWRHRHDSYTNIGIATQWLWWNQPPHLRQATGDQRTSPGIARRPALMDDLAGHDGMPWLWFDPVNAVLAVAVDDPRLAKTLGCATPNWYGQHVGVAPLELADCTLTERGLMHPLLERLTTLRAELANRDAQCEQVRRAAGRAQVHTLLTQVGADPAHPAIAALLAGFVDGGPAISDDVCEAMLRLTAVRYPVHIGSPAGPRALHDRLWSAATELGCRNIRDDVWRRAAEALNSSGFVQGGRIVGSLGAPPGSNAAATRLEVSRAASRRGPVRPPRRSDEPPTPPSPKDRESAALRPVGWEHGWAQRRGPRVALIEAREHDGRQGGLRVLAHLLDCAACRDHHWARNLSVAKALQLGGSVIPPPGTGDQRLRWLDAEEIGVLAALITRELKT
jgi:competence protein CoiA-like protein